MMTLKYGEKTNLEYLRFLIINDKLFPDDAEEALSTIVNNIDLLDEKYLNECLSKLFLNDISFIYINQKVYPYLMACDINNDNVLKNIHSFLIHHNKHELNLELPSHIAKKIVDNFHETSFFILKKAELNNFQHISNSISFKDEIETEEDINLFIQILEQINVNIVQNFVHYINIKNTAMELFKEKIKNKTFRNDVMDSLFIKYKIPEFFVEHRKYKDLSESVTRIINSDSFLLKKHHKIDNIVNAYSKYLSPFRYEIKYSVDQDKRNRLILNEMNKTHFNLDTIQYLNDYEKLTMTLLYIDELNQRDADLLLMSPYSETILLILALNNIDLDQYTSVLNQSFDIISTLLTITNTGHLLETINLLNLKTFNEILSVVKSERIMLEQHIDFI